MKTLAYELSSPLSWHFMLLYNTDNIPEDWRQSNVIYKGQGLRHSVNNYRPISITVVVCRIMEAIVRKSISSFLALNNLLNTAQIWLSRW